MSSNLEILKEMCKRANITVWDYTEDSNFIEIDNEKEGMELYVIFDEIGKLIKFEPYN